MALQAPSSGWQIPSRLLPGQPIAPKPSPVTYGPGATPNYAPQAPTQAAPSSTSPTTWGNTGQGGIAHTPAGPIAGLQAAAPTTPKLPATAGVGGGGKGTMGLESVGGSGGGFDIAAGEGGGGFMGDGGGMRLSGPNALRQGIGNRMLPTSVSALAGLQRVY